MAKGAAKSLLRKFLEKLEDTLDESVEFVFDAIGRAEEHSEEKLRLCGNVKLDESLSSMLPKVKPALIVRVRKRAYEATDRATYQAIDGLVHNLNTIHGRAGAQTPFSSLNYGTDTSAEGRMMIKNILIALNAGLGHAESEYAQKKELEIIRHMRDFCGRKSYEHKIIK